MLAGVSKQTHVLCVLLLVHETLFAKPLILNRQFEGKNVETDYPKSPVLFDKKYKGKWFFRRYTASQGEQSQVPRSLLRSLKHQNTTVEKQACRYVSRNGALSQTQGPHSGKKRR